MNVTIKVIPQNEHRYPTCGDWIFDDYGDLHIRVSKMGNWRYEMLVAIHELVEVILCAHAGVEQKEVDDFDIAYEKNRKPGDTSEPGDHKDAPYRRQHKIATKVERIVAMAMGVNWRKYEAKINSL